jgi:hypothetical protein
VSGVAFAVEAEETLAGVEVEELLAGVNAGKMLAGVEAEVLLDVVEAEEVPDVIEQEEVPDAIEQEEVLVGVEAEEVLAAGLPRRRVGASPSGYHQWYCSGTYRFISSRLWIFSAFRGLSSVRTGTASANSGTGTLLSLDIQRHLCQGALRS